MKFDEGKSDFTLIEELLKIAYPLEKQELVKKLDLWKLPHERWGSVIDINEYVKCCRLIHNELRKKVDPRKRWQNHNMIAVILALIQDHSTFSNISRVTVTSFDFKKARLKGHNLTGTGQSIFDALQHLSQTVKRQISTISNMSIELGQLRSQRACTVQLLSQLEFQINKHKGQFDGSPNCVDSDIASRIKWVIANQERKNVQIKDNLIKEQDSKIKHLSGLLRDKQFQMQKLNQQLKSLSIQTKNYSYFSSTQRKSQQSQPIVTNNQGQQSLLEAEDKIVGLEAALVKANKECKDLQQKIKGKERTWIDQKQVLLSRSVQNASQVSKMQEKITLLSSELQKTLDYERISKEELIAFKARDGIIQVQQASIKEQEKQIEAMNKTIRSLNAYQQQKCNQVSQRHKEISKTQEKLRNVLQEYSQLQVQVKKQAEVIKHLQQQKIHSEEERLKNKSTIVNNLEELQRIQQASLQALSRAQSQKMQNSQELEKIKGQLSNQKSLSQSMEQSLMQEEKRRKNVEYQLAQLQTRNSILLDEEKSRWNEETKVLKKELNQLRQKFKASLMYQSQVKLLKNEISGVKANFLQEVKQLTQEQSMAMSLRDKQTQLYQAQLQLTKQKLQKTNLQLDNERKVVAEQKIVIVEQEKLIQQLDKKVKELQYTQQKQSSLESSFDEAIELLKNQNSSEMKSLKIQYQSYLSKISQQIKQINSAYIQVQSILKQKVDEIEEKQGQILRIRCQLCLKMDQNQELRVQKSSNLLTKSQFNDHIAEKERYMLSSIFSGQVLEGRDAEKTYLKTTIEAEMGIEIAKTRFLFAYDPLNKTNFHKYIDHHPHLVMVIRMSNGYLLATYSEGGFVPKQVSTKSGLILSLTHSKCFRLKEPSKRAVTYDDYYVIYGNSEVRFKANEKKIFSNFAISNSFYDAKGFKVHELLGGDPQERELPIDGYEFYQLQLM